MDTATMTTAILGTMIDSAGLGEVLTALASAIRERAGFDGHCWNEIADKIEEISEDA